MAEGRILALMPNEVYLIRVESYVDVGVDGLTFPHLPNSNLNLALAARFW